MKRFATGLLAGLMMTGVPAMVMAANAAAKKTVVMTLNDSGCGVYKGSSTDKGGLAETLVGKAKPGQFIYVKWMEITKQAPDPDNVNIGEPQMVGSDRYKPKPKGGFFVETREGGWYVFKQGFSDTYKMDYYNRGFLPDRFEVRVCVVDETINPIMLPLMVQS